MFEGDILFGAVRGQQACSLGAEIEQRANGRAGLAAGAKFENLAEQNESCDGGGGFKIDVGLAVHSAEAWGKDLREDGCDQAVDIGDAGAHGD